MKQEQFRIAGVQAELEIVGDCGWQSN